jgi:hypothetical protein
MDEKRDMLELFAVPDVFVSGLGSVESIGGGNYRFTFFVSQEVDGARVSVVAAKIVMSVEALPEAIGMAARLTNMSDGATIAKRARN